MKFKQAFDINKLDLILEIFVQSGLVVLLPDNPADRYQLVHDYIAAFIHQQQEPKLKQVMAALEKEREQRKLSDAKLNNFLKRALFGNGGISVNGSSNGISGAGIGIENTKNDTITTGLGKDTGTITTGLGKDTITANGNSSGLNATAYGILNDGIIDTGKGSDKLTGQATATIGGTAYGIYGEGTIKTGDGNDEIIATSILDGVQQKVTIGGGIKIALGTGNDYFKGFGEATVDGGDGFDTVDLGTFNRSELMVSGVISGNTLNSANITFNNNGNSISLSRTGFEKFIFADSSFSYSTLANGA